MHQAAPMRRLQGLRNLPGNGQCGGREPPPTGGREPRRERLSLHQLHDDRQDARRFLDPDQRGDVGMVQRRQGLRLALEPRALALAHVLVRQHLQGDVARQPGIAGAIHLALTAPVEERDHLVGANPLSAGKRHPALGTEPRAQPSTCVSVGMPLEDV